MTAIRMPGGPKGVFRENIERYQDLHKQIQKCVEDHRKFAREECDLLKPADENKAFKYCQSACHPDGEHEYNHCSIGLCTWWMEGAHGPSPEEDKTLKRSTPDPDTEYTLNM